MEDSVSMLKSDASFEPAKKNVRFSETVDEREEDETVSDERKGEKTSPDYSIVGQEGMKAAIAIGEEAKIETSTDKHIASNQGETTTDDGQVRVSVSIPSMRLQSFRNCFSDHKSFLREKIINQCR